MKDLRWIAILCLCLSLILSACAPATPAPTFLPLQPEPTEPPVPLRPTAEALPTLEAPGVGVPVIEYINGQSELLVVSSLTGQPFAGFPSFPLEYYDNYAFSPDGKTLVVISKGQLYWIDLPSWTSRTREIDLHGPLYSIVYSPDGSLLALAGDTSDNLHILDARTGTLIASTRSEFSIRDLRFTTDGQALMAYGPQLAGTGVSVDVPQAALYAVSDLSLLWSVKLKGIRDGMFPKKTGSANTPDLYQPGAAWYFQPAVAFAPGQDLLYLVHGDQDKLTTVDFSARHVTTVDLQARTGWLDRLLALTAGVAHAKGMDGTTKQAVISPDGNFLFVVGNTETVTPPANGIDWNVTDTPIGLQIISPQDGTLLDKLDTAASLVRLSADGRQLLLIGWGDHGRPFTDVYDLSSRSITKHLDGIYLVPTRRLDGTAILASSDFLDGYVTNVTLLDPLTWATTGEWQGPGDVGWLMVP